VADVAIDTDVASRLQKGIEPAWVREHVVGARTWLTFVTVGELSKWAQVRGWGEVRRARLDRWIAARPVIPYDREIARIWGRLAANAQRRGRSRPQNDTWIAACCIRVGVPLVTLNRKDFTDFATHEGLILPDGDNA
jgi:predicted nucleic acid-binding protein